MRNTTMIGVFCLLCLVLPLSSGLSQEMPAAQKTDDSSMILSVNPFMLSKNRIVPGTSFRIAVDKNFDETEEVRITLVYTGDAKEKQKNIKIIGLKKEDDGRFIEAAFPEYKEISDIRKQSAWSGVLFPYRGLLSIKYKGHDFLFPVSIPSVSWAYRWGIAVVLLSFFLIALLKPNPIKRIPGFDEEKDRSREEWAKRGRWNRFFLYPLNFAITPIGSYSISITQILIWTYVTIFGLVYVYWLTGCFLDITAQVLTLLGIGGGTAIGSKMNAIARMQEVPAKYLNLVEKKRVPNLNDLISTGGCPNIFKFQMLVFTLLIAFIVVVEIAKKYSFPQIPDNLIALMGISSAVYIGNEVVQENVWEKINKKIAEIEKIAKEKGVSIPMTRDIEKLNIPEVGELKNILNGIYS
ncbi:MAG: hypothetical protein AB1442_02765 [Nitrospirota bacterium]